MIKVGIFGYGNLARGIEYAVNLASDMELCAVFTRRDPSSLKIASENVPVLHADDVLSMKGRLDVIVNCGGSATDLPVSTPTLAEHFNVIDSFDTHAKIGEHFAAVDASARAGGKVALISAGWDPGMFSLNRLYSEAVLPCGETYTFWGKGVSQGHSDAIRRIDGVLDARQYTVPVESALEAVRSGACPALKTREKHTRECFVAVKDGADKAKIENEIKTMPNYFADYDTTVNFISEDELREKHSGIPHGGFVIRTGKTGKDNSHVIEYSLKLDSNPEFTASVITAYARAVVRMSHEGTVGCKTVFDVPPAYLSSKSALELMTGLL